MDIPFRSSPRHTLGIEMEIGIVDRGSRALATASNELLAVLGEGRPGGEHPKAKHELLQCTIEAITGVCDTVTEAGTDLAETIAEIDAVARDRGLGLISSGTHPFSPWYDQQISPSERYSELIAQIAWPARRLAIHGTHFHVGVRDGEAAIALTNALAYYLPAFLALSASSPFWNGADTGMASARTKIFEGLPTAGLPPRLSGWADFESFMGTLVTAGAIRSVREVWWDVRPHPDFGTVELRMCDAMPSLGEVLTVASVAQCLVASLQERHLAGEPLPNVREWVIKENKWLASRWGLDAQLIVDDAGTRCPTVEFIGGLVEELTPMAELLGCGDELRSVNALVSRGPGYLRCRAVLDAGGTMLDVVDMLLEEFELEGRPE